MPRILYACLGALVLSISGAVAPAQRAVPDARAVYDPNTDLVGTDLANIFDTTLEACEAACAADAECTAFTFNQRSNACFPKTDIRDIIPFDGAVSGRMVRARPEVLAGLDARTAELSFLTETDFDRARDLVRGTNWPQRGATTNQREAGQRALTSDLSAAWLEYARRAGRENSRIRRNELPATIAAYLRAIDLEDRRSAAVAMAFALEREGRGRRMIPALRLAQSIRFTDVIEERLEEAIGKYGFRVINTQVDRDSATPRICATFKEDLIQAGTDYAPFVQLPDPQLVVSAKGDQLCIDGVTHGERYRFVVREGLPAASGETVNRPIELTLYVRDRSPAVRAVGRAYVLPRLGDVALPIETVNTTDLELTLHRIDDRNLMRAIQQGLVGETGGWGAGYLSDEIGAEIWSGTAEVAMELNRDMLTRLPLTEALAGQPAGLYALTASVASEANDTPSARQWFVLSDLGVATYLGNDGLTVAVRSLADASAMADATVTLISRANTVLGDTTTDADGTARFAGGLTRGTGGNAPALVTVERDGDLTYLSLTDPAFDLSDRGVEGREPSPPIDVFAATDRGAYRAGDTIHLTALMRNEVATALPGIPLTAILVRPDGVEYIRTTATADRAGGHVFTLPVAASAPRGTWRINLLADEDAAPLATTTVLVEDFLPERIDFDMDLPDRIHLGDSPTLRIDARYLFGAPGADLGVEGSALLRSATALDGFPGYRFGEYDAAFDAQRSYLDTATTDASGAATLPVALPDVTAAQPLELRVTARVKEGSGRPVERTETVPVLPDRPMIGIKPRFDGVMAENTAAGFDLIALTPDLAAADLDVQWTINKVTTRYQWYSVNGSWDWEPVTTRTRVASGTATLGTAPVAVDGVVDWGRHEILVEATGPVYAAASTDFYAGWYAPASATDTPDLLDASLDADRYALGDTATFRIVPRYAGTAVVTVMSDRVISMQSVAVTEGENLIDLPVTAEWGAGAYVSASVIRPMDAAAKRNPARALGLGYAQVDPGDKALSVTLDAPEKMEPRGPLTVGMTVDGIAQGETAYVTLAAVDVGILNLTAFATPDPQGHYFGQRKLGVELRDVYGRLIDGLNGATGTVRSGGDAMAQAGLQSPPPTEDLVTFFTGPVTVGADGRAEVSFDVPAFNGTIRLMAIAWSETGIGQADHDVIVRDPVVVTASLPRFLAPGDQSRMLLEIVHADGPAGEIRLDVAATGVTLDASGPYTFTLAEGGKEVFEIPVTARDPGTHDLTVTLTAPGDRTLTKTLRMPVVVNDPEVSRISRFTLAAGSTFTFDDNVFAGLATGTGKATLSAGPLARFDAPGLLNALDRYPYGCTEQITSRALPLLYLDGVATAMGLATRDQIAKRIDEAIAEVTANQAANGAFGLWRPVSGDLWLDAYVTDFLSRARTAGHDVPQVAFDNAVSNLRNAVNYYPDFDNGGRDLAYALFVLARQGNAAVSDLRYYADQKAEAFSSPLALAQIGAALAQYGDQPRADAMFRRAGQALDREIARTEANSWRHDYGTIRRDTAAVLTLAVEAGSIALDRDRLLTRIGTNTSRASTQEAAWTLLAANALVNDLQSTSLTIDGTPPDGPVVQLRDDRTAAAPVTIANTGTRPTELTVTTFGVPTEPEPAGGNGYAIDRIYTTLDGQQVNLADVAVGTRLVTILTVRPFGRQEARLMVDDPLPAGFEIDNPNLIRAGDIDALPWLKLAATRTTEFRADRFLAAVDWRSNETFQLAYIVRAISPGDFHHPAASVEDMYRPQMRARTAPGRVLISP
ncbi:MG2 domain-containing protein [Aestuariibius sp. 2305UL40-4]|uniref:alpha-2-macroglobulin family protein n=1 Tax=Aestuariibius violaceus TaxID=3234132 RepID=UPI00345E3B0C